MTSLSGEAIKEVERLTAEGLGRTVTIGGVEYATRELHDPRKREEGPDAIAVSTLQGFADFVQGEEDFGYREEHSVFVHVKDPLIVRLQTGLFGEYNQRALLAVANAIVPFTSFGNFLDPESFIIQLMTLFEATEDRERVFEVVGNLASREVRTVSDDGVSQSVEARKGIVKRVHVGVPTLVTLCPHRTFSEIEQVSSPFVLRLRGGGENALPTCALFECDGGMWRLEAIARIKAWLEEKDLGIPIYG